MKLVILNNGWKLQYTSGDDENMIPTGYHIWHQRKNIFININLINKSTNIVIIQKSINNPYSYIKYNLSNVPIQYRIKEILNGKGICKLKKI